MKYEGGISIDAYSGPPRYVLWCCGGICHQLLTFFSDWPWPYCAMPYIFPTKIPTGPEVEICSFFQLFGRKSRHGIKFKFLLEKNQSDLTWVRTWGCFVINNSIIFFFVLQRISLARALYAVLNDQKTEKAEFVVLLDDPLSAVDPSVG